MSNKSQATSAVLVEEPGVVGTLGATIVDGLETVRVAFSAAKYTVGTIESVARTAKGMADRNERYIEEKGDAMHSARMSQLQAQIAELEL